MPDARPTVLVVDGGVSVRESTLGVDPETETKGDHT